MCVNFVFGGIIFRGKGGVLFLVLVWFRVCGKVGGSRSSGVRVMGFWKVSEEEWGNRVVGVFRERLLGKVWVIL